MIHVKSNDKFEITYSYPLPSYDGHCLRSYSYYTEQMPDIEAKMKYADKEGKYFKVTLDDGTTKFFHESDPEFKEYQNA